MAILDAITLLAVGFFAGSVFQQWLIDRADNTRRAEVKAQLDAELTKCNRKPQ